MKIALNFSPNFDPKKRKKKEIKFIVFHYTGMVTEKKAIDKLLNHNSKVSCHYFIKNNAEIIKMVPKLIQHGMLEFQGGKKLNHLIKILLELK